jgi:PKD repeat protein
MAVVEGIAEKIGGSIIRDEITGQIKGIGAWPQSLDGIGDVEARFENPIIIDPSGIVFGDAYHVTATFASVTDALADANGPYTVPEGAEVEFDGGPVKPHTTYSWDVGDGTVLAVAVVTHRYADDGLYIAKLTTVVAEKGGVTTRHFAAVRAKNVAPTVDAGPPITIDEGAVTEFTATFTDPGWVDTHTVTFDFGDNSAPVVGTLTETHNEPLGRGTVKASHAFCDNGTYTVTVRVRDDDGGVGVDTKTVTVLNVAPTVDAGPDMFAYPCTPITLVGHFTDPGWCDTHTGTWDFGDCTPPLPATVRERHEPPEGCGIVAATHRYDTCGHFVAVCTVTDDDGGVGRDTIIVRVVDVVNGGFEDGFRTQATRHRRQRVVGVCRCVRTRQRRGQQGGARRVRTRGIRRAQRWSPRTAVAAMQRDGSVSSRDLSTRGREHRLGLSGERVVPLDATRRDVRGWASTLPAGRIPTRRRWCGRRPTTRTTGSSSRCAAPRRRAR